MYYLLQPMLLATYLYTMLNREGGVAPEIGVVDIAVDERTIVYKGLILPFIIWLIEMLNDKNKNPRTEVVLRGILYTPVITHKQRREHQRRHISNKDVGLQI